MRSEWATFRLGDVADVSWGDTKTTKSSYVDSGYPAYSASGQDGYLPHYDYEKVGVVLSAIGADCGRTWLASGKWSCIKNTIRFWSTSAKVTTEYLYLITNSQSFWPRRGSAQPFISQTDARDLMVRIPDIKTQQYIWGIISSLDSRITLLRETNITLEAIAQAIFKSWFVDFDPVHAKAEGRAPEGMDEATAALFPDTFEETELGMVPVGWVIGRLIDLAKLKGGKMLSKEYFSVDGEFPVYGGAGEMGRSNLSNAEGFVITVGRVGAYCGQYFWHLGKAWVNNNASQVIPHDWNYSLWVYQLLRSVDMNLIKKGAAQPFVSNGDIENLQIMVPAASVIREFVGVCEPLFDRMSSALASISTLTNLRDTLLPRLISGQLRLPEAEDLVESAVS